jgi:hypothetical protein
MPPKSMVSQPFQTLGWPDDQQPRDVPAIPTIRVDLVTKGTRGIEGDWMENKLISRSILVIPNHQISSNSRQ